MPRYRFRCTDKLTGKATILCAEGDTSDIASEKIWELGFFISESKLCPWVKNDTSEHKVNPDFWKHFDDDPDLGPMPSRDKRKVGLVYHAIMENTDDTKRLLLLYNTECHLIDRHMYLCHLIGLAERRKVDSMFCELLEMFCWQWMVERHEICKAVVEGELPKYDRGGYMYEIPAVNRLRIEHSDGERGAQVCDFAIGLKNPPQNVEKLKYFADKYRKANPL